MRIDETVVGDVLVLALGEERIDSKNASELKELVIQLVGRGHRRILADLSRVAFVDSTGLGALVSGVKLVGREGEFALCGLNDMVSSLFKLTRMDRVFRLHRGQAEALAAFAHQT